MDTTRRTIGNRQNDQIAADLTARLAILQTHLYGLRHRMVSDVDRALVEAAINATCTETGLRQWRLGDRVACCGRACRIAGRRWNAFLEIVELADCGIRQRVPASWLSPIEANDGSELSRRKTE